jgi:MoaA/NifB/PqqE/SkfB family radical SAM enzyme
MEKPDLMSSVQYNNSNQISRILLRLSSYDKITFNLIRKGVPLGEIIKTKFPYFLKDNKKPCSLSLELGNVCNLRCVYCNIPHMKNKREFMGREIFEKILENLKGDCPNRIRIGGGEPTLHPDFNDFMNRLRKYTRFLSIVTNAQWNQPNMAEILVQVPFDLIEVSMDVGGKEVYESSRLGSSFELFENNLRILKELKQNSGKRIIINMRLMVRPSNTHQLENDKKRWGKYCDTVMPQLITSIPETNYTEDVFIPSQKENRGVPRCTMPFKDLMIKPNGDIPFCQVTGNAIYRERLIAGNILDDSIGSIWNTKIKKMRVSHRTRIFDSFETDYCKGCSGR